MQSWVSCAAGQALATENRTVAWRAGRGSRPRAAAAWPTSGSTGRQPPGMPVFLALPLSG
jgi:hypothetical protein